MHIYYILLNKKAIGYFANQWLLYILSSHVRYNPTQPHWKLCRYPEEYKYSSAKFYEQGIDEFGFLTHYLE